MRSPNSYKAPKKYKHTLGNKILKIVPYFEVRRLRGFKPATTARHFAKTKQVLPPAVIEVLTNSRMKEKFFLSLQGLFDFGYVARNYRAFPELQPYRAKIISQIGKRKNHDNHGGSNV